jgi:ABC-2 type transport system ATP-binding protein
MRQRLGIAQAVIHRPQLLILDEPVSALDPLGRREILDLLHELKKETTILFSTHVLHDAGEVCEDVLIIRDGKLAVSGDLNAVLRGNRKPVIKIDTDGDQTAWLMSLAGKPYVLEAETGRSSATLTVDDPDLARDALLKEIVDAGVPVTRFEVGQTTLEDLFVKVVQE